MEKCGRLLRTEIIYYNSLWMLSLCLPSWLTASNSDLYGIDRTMRRENRDLIHSHDTDDMNWHQIREERSILLLFNSFHVLTRERRRQGWSVPSAWRGRGVWRLTHRCSVHSDTRAWGWAWSATHRGKDRGGRKGKTADKLNKPLDRFH